MSAGNVQVQAIPTGGAQTANASQLARWIAQLDVCTGGTPNQLLNAGDPTSLRSLAGFGPLVEAAAFRQQGGQPCYLMPINPSLAGALGAVSSLGSGNMTLSVSSAPHVPITVKCVTGGAQGTAQFQVSVNGGNFGATFTPTAGSPTYAVPGTFCVITFPSATYVVNTTATIGIDGTVTLGTSWVGNITQTSSPLDWYEFFLSVATPGGFGVGQLLVSPDNGPTGGGSTLGAFLLTTNGKIVLPNTGVVLTIGNHTVLITITTPGALGTALFSYQIDGGSTVSGQATTPNSGSSFVWNAPGTGLTFTFAPGTYVNSSTYTMGATGTITLGGGAINTVTATWAGLQTNDSFAFLSAPPSYSTTDLNNALTALINARNFQISGVHVSHMPSSAASAVAQQAAIDSAMQSAFTNNNLDWQAWCECPSSQGRGGLGDVVISGGVAITDVADTDTVVAAARGSDTTRTGVHVASYRMTSPLTKFNMARPLGWAASWMFVRTDPGTDLAAVANGPLPIYITPGATSIGRDESVTPAMDAVQFNSARTYPGQPNQVFFTITSGGGGWKNCSTNASWQDARGVRVLNVGTAQMRPVIQQLLGASAVTNPDGTIEEIQRRSWTTTLDSQFKRGLGLSPGGPFAARQASAASATVLASSQLGVSPKQLLVNQFIQQLGEATSISVNTYFGGVVPPGA